eukprot:284626-Pelagomonas_calceolata.AAC.2
MGSFVSKIVKKASGVTGGCRKYACMSTVYQLVKVAPQDQNNQQQVSENSMLLNMKTKMKQCREIELDHCCSTTAKL